VRPLQKLATLINLATYKRIVFRNLENFTPLLAPLISFFEDAKIEKRE